jgi:hypothetical protein
MKSTISPISSGIALADITEVQVGYTCPVCANILSVPPRDFHICPCCGTEFGNDDVEWTHAQLRAAWMEDGFKWWSTSTPAPADWNGVTQVLMLIPLLGSADAGEITGQENDLFRVETDVSSGSSDNALPIWGIYLSANSEVTCLD